MKEVFSMQTDFTNELFTSKFMENSPFHNFKHSQQHTKSITTTLSSYSKLQKSMIGKEKKQNDYEGSVFITKRFYQ